MALFNELALGNTVVKLRWEEPFASSGIDRKDLAVIPRGIYRGFKAQPGVGLNLDIVPDPVLGESLAVFETSGSAAVAPNYNPTPGWNVAIFTSSTITIAVPGAVATATNKAVVLRAQFNEGNFPVTDAFIQIIDAADVKPVDIIICLLNVPVGPPPDLTTSTITNGPTASSLAPLFVTVGDGFESKGDFTGNRASAATSDTSNVIQAAIAALDARNKIMLTGAVAPFTSFPSGVIFVKRGQYSPTTAIVPLTTNATGSIRNGLRIVGEGVRATLIQRAAGIPVFDFSVGPVPDGEVSNMGLLGTMAGAVTPMIQTSAGTTRCLFKDLEFAFGSANNDTGINMLGSQNVMMNIQSFGTPNGVVKIGSGAHSNTVLTDTIINGSLVSGAIFPVNSGASDRVLTFGDERNLVFGTLQNYMKGHIRGMEVLVSSLISGAILGPPVPASGHQVIVMDGIIEIDGVLYENLIPVDITAGIAPASGSFTYVYARRNTTTGVIEYTTYSGNANAPIYRSNRKAWTKPGTGLGSASERYIGCVLCDGAGPLSFVAQIKVGETVYFEKVDLLPVVTVTIPFAPAISTAIGLPTPTSLTRIPPIPSKDTSIIPPGGGELILASQVVAILDVEVVISSNTLSEVTTLTVTLAGDPTSAGVENQRTSLTATFIGNGGGAIPAPRIKFPTVQVVAAVIPATFPTLTIIASRGPVAAGAPMLQFPNKTFTVNLYQRGYVDQR